MQRINYLISLLATLLVLFLVGIAFYLSFESLKDLAVQIGVSEGIAWLYPTIIDGAIIVFSLSVLPAKLARDRTIYPWELLSVFTLMSVILNIVHAQHEKWTHPMPFNCLIYIHLFFYTSFTVLSDVVLQGISANITKVL